MNARSTPSGITSVLIEPCRKNCMSFADHVGTCSRSARVDDSFRAASVRSVITRKATLAMMTNSRACTRGATPLRDRSFTRLVQRSLSAGDADDDSRNVLCVDKSVEVLRASKVGKMNDVVGDLRDFAAHFLSRS